MQPFKGLLQIKGQTMEATLVFIHSLDQLHHFDKDLWGHLAFALLVQTPIFIYGHLFIYFSDIESIHPQHELQDAFGIGLKLKKGPLLVFYAESARMYLQWIQAIQFAFDWQSGRAIGDDYVLSKKGFEKNRVSEMSKLILEVSHLV